MIANSRFGGNNCENSGSGRQLMEECIKALRQQLDKTQFREVWSQGQPMYLEEALQLALSGQHEESTTAV
jgi:hypothetical protein